jgi:hypothetical protein
MTSLDNDTFVETTRTSFFGRIKNAVAGLLVGPIFIFGGVYLLSWNEGRSARAIHALRDGQRSVALVSSDTVDGTREGKLVYVQGLATTSEILSDSAFGVSKEALWLRRDSEMYQWQEEKDSTSEKGLDGSETKRTTYTYRKVWSSSLIKSSHFKRPSGHENPSHFRAPSNLFVARDARLGAFHLDPGIVRSIDGESAIEVAQNQRAPSFPDARAHDGGFFFGADPNQPAIGDIRVRFYAVSPGVISVAAAQVGMGLGTFVADNGYEIALVRAGIHSADELFEAALAENTLITWLIRFGGLLVLWIGFATLFSIVTVLASIIPFVGTLVGMGTGFVSFLLALVTWSVTIAVAWLAHRPMAAVLLAGVTITIGAWLYRRKARVIAASQSKNPVSAGGKHRALAG